MWTHNFHRRNATGQVHYYYSMGPPYFLQSSSVVPPTSQCRKRQDASWQPSTESHASCTQFRIVDVEYPSTWCCARNHGGRNRPIRRLIDRDGAIEGCIMSLPPGTRAFQSCAFDQRGRDRRRSSRNVCVLWAPWKCASGVSPIAANNVACCLLRKGCLEGPRKMQSSSSSPVKCALEEWSIVQTVVDVGAVVVVVCCCCWRLIADEGSTKNRSATFAEPGVDGGGREIEIEWVGDALSSPQPPQTAAGCSQRWRGSVEFWQGLRR